MLYEKDKNKIPKKIAQKISKFSYYVDTFFPDHFAMKQNTLDLQKKVDKPLNQLLTKVGNRNLAYNYFYSKCQNPAAINSNSILGSVKKLYLNQDVIKINQMSYSRQSIFKQSYLPVYGFFSQIIDFVLIMDKEEKTQNLQKSRHIPDSLAKSKSGTNLNQQPKESSLQQGKTLKTQSKPKEYWLYVIHNCNSFKPESDQIKKISWEHFIQRYHFVDKVFSDANSVSTVEYELVYCYKSNQSFLSFQQKLTRLFIQSHCKVIQKNNTLQNLEKLQGYLLQRSSQVEANQKQEHDVAFSDQHRRQTKIPIQHFKQYMALKKQIYKFYVNLHNCESQQEINKYFYENLICRYLIAKQYHFEQAKKGIQDYIKWQKQLRQKYPSIDCFKQYHSLGAYKYIGQDFMGRPIMLSKSALIDVNKLADVQRYCDYYIYYLEIYLRSKMRGYVDQMLVIADLDGLGSNNFKLAITKRNLSDSLKYGPQRQFGLIVVNAGSFAHTAWVFIKPLMPKKTLHKIQISGHDKKQIIQALSSRMDISVIPQYLGGQNKDFQLQFKKSLNMKQEEQQFVKSHKAVSAMSRLESEGINQFEQLELVSSKSAITQVKNENIIISFFSNITKSIGIRFSD